MFIQNLTAHVAFLSENQITAEQHLLLYCLYLDRLETKEQGRWFVEATGKGRPISNLYVYHSLRKWTPAEIDDLADKGFLVNKNAKGRYFPDNLEVTDKFIDALFARRKEFYEFLELYPAFTDSFHANDNRKVPLKMVGEEEIFLSFVRNVNTKAEHSRMMRALQWAVENNQISVKITNFLDSHYWTSLETLMDEQDEETNSRGMMA